jgi:hypothetical protein
MTKDEIKKILLDTDVEIRRLEARRSEAKRKLAEMTAKWEPGQRVLWRGAEYEITSYEFWYGEELQYRGRKVLKSGALHAKEQNLYGSGLISSVPQKVQP